MRDLGAPPPFHLPAARVPRSSGAAWSPSSASSPGSRHARSSTVKNFHIDTQGLGRGSRQPPPATGKGPGWLHCVMQPSSVRRKLPRPSHGPTTRNVRLVAATPDESDGKHVAGTCSNLTLSSPPCLFILWPQPSPVPFDGCTHQARCSSDSSPWCWSRARLSAVDHRLLGPPYEAFSSPWPS